MICLFESHGSEIKTIRSLFDAAEKLLIILRKKNGQQTYLFHAMERMSSSTRSRVSGSVISDRRFGRGNCGRRKRSVPGNSSTTFQNGA
jgi:hypothetical protein